MKRFSRLYTELDATTRTNEKVAALERYFRDAPPADAAWALFFLAGRKIKRSISSTELRAAASEASGVPEWLFNECYDAVGDLSETIALLLPDPPKPEDIPLSAVVRDFITPLKRMSDTDRRATLLALWPRLPADQRLIFHKLITGSFRVGVSRTLTVRALSAVAGVEQAEMEHRVMGDWEPTPEDFAALLSGSDHKGAAARPYPFFLASQLDDPPDSLGDLTDWLVEWKWDGIRCQAIRRAGATILWSRGEEIVTDRFPELEDAASELAEGTVLDGEILAWDRGRPLPFHDLQRRIGRVRQSNLGGMLFADTPVVFMAFDILESRGAETRALSLSERRALLEATLVNAPPAFRPSPLITTTSWAELATLRAVSREKGVEGVMLKRHTSPYGSGRTRGDWWKWKIEPYSVDAVLVAAQPGHGRRASVFTDYTFALWNGPDRGAGELVPFAKAYSGLTDAEIDRVDRFVRTNTTERFGPVRAVEPRLVFELAFEAIQPSTRHRSGVAVRFPRIAKWREDKKPQEADTLANLLGLLTSRPRTEQPPAPGGTAPDPGLPF
jgi:DNA ligase-1